MCVFIPWVKKMKQKSLKFNSIDLCILADFCTKNELFFGRGGATNRGGVQPPFAEHHLGGRLFRRHESSKSAVRGTPPWGAAVSTKRPDRSRRPVRSAGRILAHMPPPSRVEAAFAKHHEAKRRGPAAVREAPPWVATARTPLAKAASSRHWLFRRHESSNDPPASNFSVFDTRFNSIAIYLKMKEHHRVVVPHLFLNIK